MRRWTWLMTSMIVTSALVSAPSVHSAEAGWGMESTSPYVGRLYLYTTAQGFAVVMPKTGAKFVMHAPDWQVVMYNDRTRVYYVENPADIQALAKSPKAKQAEEMARRANLNNARKGKAKDIAGLQATQYFVQTNSPDGAARQAEVWLTTKIRRPQQLTPLLSKMIGIDTSSFPNGMPLRVVVYDDKGKQELLFDTLKAEPKSIQSSAFKYPTNYKQVNNELAVFVDEKSRRKMESLLEDSEELDALLNAAANNKTTPTGAPLQTNTNGSPATNGTTNSVTTPAPAAAPTAGSPSKDWWVDIIKKFTSK